MRRKTRTIIAGGRSTVREHVSATRVYVCVDFLGSTFPVSFCIEPGQRQAGAVGGSPDVAQSFARGQIRERSAAELEGALDD